MFAVHAYLFNENHEHLYPRNIPDIRYVTTYGRVYAVNIYRASNSCQTKIILQRAECLYYTFVVFVIFSHSSVHSTAIVSGERAEGLEAVFRCQYQAEGFDVLSYHWFINNFFVGAETETVRVRRPLSPGGPATLTILATPQHNNSVVYCSAVIRNGTDITDNITSAESSTASLVVRGESIFNIIS